MNKSSTSKNMRILTGSIFKMIVKAMIMAIIALVADSILFTSFARLQAQTPVPDSAAFVTDGIRYGILGMGNYNRHTAQFLNLPGIPIKKKEDILGFASQEGTGFGFSAGGFIEAPIFSWLNVDLRGTYIQHNGTLYSGLDSVLLGRRDGTGAAGIFRREFQVNLASVGGEILFALNPIARLNIYAGVRAEWAVAKTYQLEEVLIAPSDGVFESGKRTRNEQGGTIPEVRNFGVANMNAELVAGIGYEFPIMPSAAWTLEPTAFYAKQINSVVQNLDAGGIWKIDAIRAGVSLRYYPVRESRFDAQAFKVKQLVALEKQIMQERSKIQAELHELRQAGVLVKLGAPVGVMSDGSIVEQPTVHVEEFRSNAIVQLLPHVFFNEQSAVLPARYKRIAASERKNYSFNKLASLAAADVHFHLLNIVGKRLQERVEASVTLTGYSAGASETKNPRNFARQRAEAVSDYLQDVWKIPASRITVKEQAISDDVASSADAQADYRRVDIASQDAALLQPLVMDAVYRTITTPALRYAIDINAGAGLKQWNMEMSQFEGNESRTLKTVEGTSSYPKEYIWRLDEHPSSIPNVSGNIETKLDVTDVNNRNGDAPILSTPVTVIMLADKISRKTKDTHVDIVTLVTPLGQNLTENEVLTVLKPLISTSSSVSVEGWAEGSGEAFNTQGADARAKDLARIIATLGITAKVKSSVPAASWMKPLNTDPTIPEGRLYNRAVRVEIRTATQ